ncbi:MAG TPA: universal stress protein [Solirubrobacteraceae bacterium]
MLCAFDVSEPSMLAAHAAAWLAGELGAPLELVYVLDPGALPALPPRGPARDPHLRQHLYKLQERRVAASAREDLDAAVCALPAEDASGTVLTGWPVEQLRRRATERQAALLVSGTAARRGFQHILRGSVSGDLAAEAPCPLVAVPPDAALAEPGPVLVGDDGSDHAGRAVRHAEALAGRLGRELVRHHVEDGDPVEELARAAHEQRACLAVTGTRGRGPLRGQLLGSVSTGLVRAAGRPVMLVSQRAGSPA